MPDIWKSRLSKNDGGYGVAFQVFNEVTTL
jgi:hypothetical protein